MNFNFGEAMSMLERMPQVLELWLSGLPEGWLQTNEGEGTWNAAQVIDHLIEAERTNWIPRVEWLLREGASKPFPPFDRFAHLQEREDRLTTEQKLDLFRRLRGENLDRLRSLVDPAAQLELTGCHPTFGTVKLRELLSAWTIHDFTHTAQIVRVLAERYRADVGPWAAFLGVLQQRHPPTAT